MATGQTCKVPMTDEQLLDDFVTYHDEEAFEALVRRHGPMVLGVCRRVLQHPQDAEDAFQATFLVLVRKAASLEQRDPHLAHQPTSSRRQVALFPLHTDSRNILPRASG